MATQISFARFPIRYNRPLTTWFKSVAVWLGGRSLFVLAVATGGWGVGTIVTGRIMLGLGVVVVATMMAKMALIIYTTVFTGTIYHRDNWTLKTEAGGKIYRRNLRTWGLRRLF